LTPSPASSVMPWMTSSLAPEGLDRGAESTLPTHPSFTSSVPWLASPID
jgi:hypothetical protein